MRKLKTKGKPERVGSHRTLRAVIKVTRRHSRDSVVDTEVLEAALDYGADARAAKSSTIFGIAH